MLDETGQIIHRGPNRQAESTTIRYIVHKLEGPNRWHSHTAAGNCFEIMNILLMLWPNRYVTFHLCTFTPCVRGPLE